MVGWGKPWGKIKVEKESHLGLRKIPKQETL